MKVRVIQIFLLFYLLFLTGSVHAQVSGIRKYTQLDGYKATDGYMIEQDAQGYLWIGSSAGGLRFDGTEFSQLQNQYSEILQCVPLTHDRILLNSITGHPKLLDHGKIIPMDTTGDADGEPDFNVLSLDGITGATWLHSGRYGSITYRFCGTMMQRYHLPSDSFCFYSVINDKIVCTWSSDGAVFLYDPKLRSYSGLYDEQGRRLFTNRGVSVVFANNSSCNLLFEEHLLNRVSVFMYTGDSMLGLVNRIPIPFPNPVTWTNSSSQGKQYLFFKSLDRGLVSYCPDVNAPDAERNVLTLDVPGAINSSFVDRDENLWLTTSNNVLYFLSARHVRNAFAAQSFHFLAQPRSISGDMHGLICAGYVNRKLVTLHDHGQTVTIPLNDSFIQGCRGILFPGNDKVILYSSDIVLLDSRSRKAHFMRLPFASYKDVCMYGNDMVAAAGSEVFYIHDALKDHPKYSYDRIFSSRSTAVETMPDSNVLIGTPTGMFRIKPYKGEAVRLGTSILSRASVADIVAMPGNRALVGTNGQGVLIYEPGRERVITDKTGDVPLRIRQLFRESDRIYWAATDMGAYRFLFDEQWRLERTMHYTFYDGLPSNNVTSVFVHKDTAFLTTPEGMALIPLLDSGLLHMKEPAIRLISMRAGSRMFTDPDSVVTLGYRERDLEFNISALSYESLGNITYYYRLHPVQSGWTQTTDRHISISGLDPGKYVFYAFATNAKGTRSLQMIRQEIIIRPAFWQTIYFKIAVVLLFLGLFYLLIRRNVQRKERQKYVAIQQKKHFAELELEAIKAQINPHFIYNCLNSIQYLNYKEEYGQAQQYLDIFAKLIRATMRYSRKVFISLEEEIAYLSQYLQLEQLRFKDKLEYEIRVDPGVSQSTQLPAMLLQPYVENALKHGVSKIQGTGRILVHFTRVGENLCIFIKDNGPGFSDVDKEGSLGLRLSGSRAKSYNELFNIHIDVHFYSEQEQDKGGTGAVILITIKNKEHGTAPHLSSYYRR